MTQPHTPAPWHVDQQDADMTTTLLIRAADDTIICEIIGETIDDFAEEERESNAALIAAAPELLAALVVMLDYADSDDFDGAPSNAAREKARAAIAKARGANP